MSEKEWISIEDRLPGLHEVVMVALNPGLKGAHLGGEIGMGYLYDTSHIWSGPLKTWKVGATMIGFSGVTHWMPLPEPPGGKK